MKCDSIFPLFLFGYVSLESLIPNVYYTWKSVALTYRMEKEWLD